jgi:predicted phosphodiesterase
MKLAIISDIHGNYHALEAVLQDVELQRADRIYVLGDLVFKGPLPERCVRRVRELNAVVLQGNIDELVGRDYIQPGFAKSPEHEAALRKEMEWTRARLTADDLGYLAGLLFSHEEEPVPGFGMRLVHANPDNLLDIVLPTDDEETVLGRMFRGTDARLVVYGHIHQPYVRFIGGRTIVNTGSVGLPFDGNPAASYALVDTGSSGAAVFSITIRRVPYDVEAAVSAFEGSGHPFAESVIAALRAGSRPV